MEKLLFIDTETTGVNHWQHSMHQMSGAVVIDGEIKEYFDIRMRPHPRAKIDPVALEKSGVTLEQIMEYQPLEDAYKEFVAMLEKYVDKFNKKDKFFFVGYNASFDNNFVRALFKQNFDEYFGSWFWAGTIDIMVMALWLLTGSRHKMENFKLSTVCEFLGIEIDEEKLHDAKYDIKISIDLYYKITELMRRT